MSVNGVIFGGDGFAQITGKFEPITLTGGSARMSVCDNCMNNPKNNPFASGFCNCALPAMERGDGWFQGGRTQTEKTFVTSNLTINYGSSKSVGTYIQNTTVAEPVREMPISKVLDNALVNMNDAEDILRLILQYARGENNEPRAKPDVKSLFERTRIMEDKAIAIKAMSQEILYTLFGEEGVTR